MNFRSVSGLPKIDRHNLLTKIKKELTEILKEEDEVYKLPIDEAILRVNKSDYSAYPLNEVSRTWINSKQNALNHRNNGNLKEEDAIVFEIISLTKAYRKKHGLYYARTGNYSKDPTFKPNMPVGKMYA